MEHNPNATLALRILEWHGGQSSALYGVGSCLLAGDDSWRLSAGKARAELLELACAYPDHKGELQSMEEALSRLCAMDEFVKGYIDCALWSSSDTQDGPGGRELSVELSDICSVGDIDEVTFDRMVNDCRKFRQQFSAALSGWDHPDSENGHNFWLARNRHGSGFLDSGKVDGSEEFLGRVLDDGARSFGEVDLTLGDDGRVY